MSYIFTRQADLPLKVKGFVIQDEEANYNIYVNQALCIEAQRECVLHELKHIKRRHLDECMNVDELEYELHN